MNKYLKYHLKYLSFTNINYPHNLYPIYHIYGKYFSYINTKPMNILLKNNVFILFNDNNKIFRVILVLNKTKYYNFFFNKGIFFKSHNL